MCGQEISRRFEHYYFDVHPLLILTLASCSTSNGKQPPGVSAAVLVARLKLGFEFAAGF